MRRFGAILAAFLLVVILVVVEIVVIKSASNYEPVSEVIFAKVRIPEKCEITAEMLEVKKIGIGLVHRLSLRNIRDVEGKRASMEIEAGEMILAGKLGYEGMENIEVRDKSKRLYSVEFKGDQANGWWLITDQNVDILFVPDKNAQASGDSKMDANSIGTEENSEIISGNRVQKLRDIRIAALIDENGTLLKNKDRTTLPKYVSFEVTDLQAEFLAYAKSNGRLELCVIPE
ncbi:MAG: hypothetical protein FIA99_10400 [Ruminiclostridium sp.]|nr:hypothetical protein [Ruminiclostridium sp.]